MTNVSSTNGSSTPAFDLALAFDSMNRLMSSLLRSRSSANFMSSNFSEIQQILTNLVPFPEQKFTNLFFKETQWQRLPTYKFSKSGCFSVVRSWIGWFRLSVRQGTSSLVFSRYFLNETLSLKGGSDNRGLLICLFTTGLSCHLIRLFYWIMWKGQYSYHQCRKTWKSWKRNSRYVRSLGKTRITVG